MWTNYKNHWVYNPGNRRKNLVFIKKLQHFPLQNHETWWPLNLRVREWGLPRLYTLSHTQGRVQLPGTLGQTLKAWEANQVQSPWDDLSPGLWASLQTVWSLDLARLLMYVLSLHYKSRALCDFYSILITYVSEISCFSGLIFLYLFILFYSLHSYHIL